MTSGVNEGLADTSVWIAEVVRELDRHALPDLLRVSGITQTMNPSGRGRPHRVGGAPFPDQL